MTVIIVRVAENREFVSSYYIFRKYLLSIYSVLNTVLDFEDTALNRANKISLTDLYSSGSN